MKFVVRIRLDYRCSGGEGEGFSAIFHSVKSSPTRLHTGDKLIIQKNGVRWEVSVKKVVFLHCSDDYQVLMPTVILATLPSVAKDLQAVFDMFHSIEKPELERQGYTLIHYKKWPMSESDAELFELGGQIAE